MDIQIDYCGGGGYKPRAVSLAGKLKKAYAVEATLQEGAGGVFDVTVDGELVYSKHRTGQFPDEAALVVAAEGVQEAAIAFAANHDGSAFAGIDKALPAPEKYKGKVIQP